MRNLGSARFRHIHFIGIGGAGMSGIAEVLLSQGFSISGSDMKASPVTEHLESLGIVVRIGHRAEWVEDADLVVYSSAVPEDNPERIAGRERGVPVIRRAEMLGELMRLKYTIAVAGTHGKTTTTSMIGQIWNRAELQPTIIVGGIVGGLGSGAQAGSSQYLIAEADEYDRSFLEMTPSVAVLTNVDVDHLDCYGGLEDIRRAFVTFANRVPFYGHVVACIDDAGVKSVLPDLRRPIVSYGFSEEADYRAENVQPEGGQTRFSVVVRGKAKGDILIKVPGRHNILNALAAIAVSLEEGVEFPLISEGLAKFEGVRRRFEYKGSVREREIYEDYAHHPTEVSATLRAARENWPGRRVVVLFQPHLYTRTRDQAEAFGLAFLESDLLLLAPIYGAREKPIEGVSSSMIGEAAQRRGHQAVHLLGVKEDSVDLLRELSQPGDLIIVMGAGNIGRMSDELLEQLR